MGHTQPGRSFATEAADKNQHHLPGPFPPFPATISWMLLLLSQSRPLSTALALPQRGVVLLHITHFISPVKHFCISFPLFCGLVITDWPNCFPVVN